VGITHLTGAARDGFATVMPGKLWRFDGSVGMTRCSAGWPGTPGMFTDATIPKVRGFLDGKEVPIAVQALRGKHPDGSYRSVGVQVVTPASTFKRAFRLEIWSTARSGGNTLTWIEPTYGLKSGESATDWPAVSYNAVVACTDAEHLCNSYVALQPLQPTADDGATSAAIFGVGNGSTFDEWITFMDTKNVSPIGENGATYEMVHAFQTGYVRSGSTMMYERAHRWLVGQLGGSDYWSPTTDATDAYAKIVTVDSTLPAKAGSGDAGTGTEAHAGAHHGWATGYLMSGWKQPWRKLAHHQSWRHGTHWVMGTNGIRVNARWDCGVLVPAYTVEATMRVGGGWGDGRDPAVRTYAAQLPALIDEFEEWVYDDFSTGYADGVVGAKQTSVDGSDAGRFPLFQFMLVGNLYINYYNNVLADSRIPARLKIIADFVIAQSTLNGGETEAYWPYVMTAGAPPSAGNTDPYWQGFWAELFGFMYAYETDPTDKALYLKYLNIAMLDTQYDTFSPKNTKAFGEYFGLHQTASYYRDGGAVRGVTGAHPSAITEPPAWSS